MLSLVNSIKPLRKKVYTTNLTQPIQETEKEAIVSNMFDDTGNKQSWKQNMTKMLQEKKITDQYPS